MRLVDGASTDTVIVPVAAAVPDTGTESGDGEQDTPAGNEAVVQETVAVPEKAFGVTVIVEVPELPATTTADVAASVTEPVLVPDTEIEMPELTAEAA